VLLAQCFFFCPFVHLFGPCIICPSFINSFDYSLWILKTFLVEGVDIPNVLMLLYE
jgi:hypothetical protein